MTQTDDQSSKPETGDEAERVLELARERFKRSVEAESENVQRQKDDIKFAAASPDDPWQWPEAARREREIAGRPCLTFNKLPQHIKQVTNDFRQNRASIKYRAANEKAAPETAEILTGLARHIEANSDADTAYDTAIENGVRHGVGYVRVLTDYVGDDSFDQDIFIKPILDTFKVHMDPAALDPAGADQEFSFIEESLQEAEFKEQYPKAQAVDWEFPGSEDWFSRSGKTVRVAEYFCIEREDAELLLWTNGSTSFKGDKLPDGVMVGEQPIKTRNLKRKSLVWRKMTGTEVLEKRTYKWQFVPIARMLGNLELVDGKRIVSGLVRNAKDAQRMYNVAQTAVVERVMMAPKAPWTVAAAAIEGHEDKWATANTSNLAYLPYNHLDDQSNQIPSPVRTAPATVEPGLQQVAMAAADDIKGTTAQYDASLGSRSNETSGKAIMARQREGDIATFHYIDNARRCIRHVGRIILDIAPTVYDARRVARILGEDGTEDFAHVDPKMGKAYAEMQTDDGSIAKIFNPSVGRYDVAVTTGPSFTTRRMEAVDAMSQMTQANPQLWQVIGDQLVRNMDWPGADDMAERLKVTLLPQVQQMLGDQGKQTQIPPQVQTQIDQMGEQIKQLSHALENAAQAAESKDNEARKLEIDAYNAETNRLKVIGPAIDEQAIQSIVLRTVSQILSAPSIDEGGMPPDMQMPMPGMQPQPMQGTGMQMQPMPPPLAMQMPANHGMDQGAGPSA